LTINGLKKDGQKRLYWVSLCHEILPAFKQLLNPLDPNPKEF